MPEKWLYFVKRHHFCILTTPALSKVFEKLLNEQIEEYLNTANIYNKTEFGFRKNYFTKDALVYLTETKRCKLDKKKTI